MRKRPRPDQIASTLREIQNVVAAPIRAYEPSKLEGRYRQAEKAWRPIRDESERQAEAEETEKQGLDPRPHETNGRRTRT